MLRNIKKEFQGCPGLTGVILSNRTTPNNINRKSRPLEQRVHLKNLQREGRNRLKQLVRNQNFIDFSLRESRKLEDH